ncbi:MAG: hypothetical protein LC799_34285, partial [Actinobacteria bacterium]|nr:hypothetical protein [Actinomycetota bacterium]
GTPPRGRGRRQRDQRLMFGTGNTPARAGTTLAELGLYRRSRAQSISADFRAGCSPQPFWLGRTPIDLR